VKISKGLKHFGRYLKRNSPSILTGLAVGGLISTVIMAVKATPKALEDIDKATIEKNKILYSTKYEWAIEPADSLTALEVVQATWKNYIPAALLGTATIGCIIGANSLHLKRQAVLAGAYSLAEVTLKEYQAKVVDTIGEKKEQEIRDKIMEDRIKANPRQEGSVIIVGGGETDFYESYSGRYFKHNIEQIRKAVNEFNRLLIKDGWSSINELYSLWGLEAIVGGVDVGWTGDYLVDISFSAIIDPKTERPCLAIEYIRGPKEERFL
jgi:hypothetical protein